MLRKTFTRRHFDFFFQNIGVNISCKISTKKTVCIKCQSLFVLEKKKNSVNISSAELSQRVVTAKEGQKRCHGKTYSERLQRKNGSERHAHARSLTRSDIVSIQNSRLVVYIQIQEKP